MVMPLINNPKQDGIEVHTEPPIAWQKTSSVSISTITITPDEDYLSWEDDPILAELWDNEEDAAAFNDAV